jgi:hypothetical protein
MPNVVEKFGVKFWNGSYYCSVVFPNGTRQELKSDADLTYTQWQVEIQKAWDASQVPEPKPGQCTCPACKKPFDCPNRTRP